MDSVLSNLISDSIGPGLLAKRFAQSVSRYLGVAGGVALREYTRSLEVALDALNLAPGSRVVLSPLSPGMYLHVLKKRGFKPLFADVDSDSPVISVDSIKNLLSHDPHVLLIHYHLGFIPDMEEISNLGIPIIEDISHSFGGNTVDRRCGNYGRYIIISLEPENIITSGGGGMILAQRSKDLTAFKKVISDLPEETVLSDINASLGVVQMSSLESFIQARKEIARIFTQALVESKHKTLIQSIDSENVFFSFPVLLESGMAEVRKYAEKKNVQTLPAFDSSIIKKLNQNGFTFPNAKTFFFRTLLFPLYPAMGKRNTEHVARVLSTLP